MKLLCNLRGTSGSGKTTVPKTFMERYGHTDIRNELGKPIGVKVVVPEWNHPVFFIGKYTNVCGGLDTVRTQVEAGQMSIEAHQHGHVICEGLLASGVGPDGALPAAIIRHAWPNARFLFLDTPLEVCIERVKGRRAARGNDKEFNPQNTESKHKQVHRSYELLKEYSPIWIEHMKAFDQVFSIIQEHDRRE